MAIGTDAGIEFFGTQDTVTAGGGTSAVTDGSFSAGGDVVSGGWTNDDDALYASAVLTCTYSTAPTAKTTVSLYARLMDINGTNDQLVPTANFPHVFLGAFPLKDVTSAQYIPIDIGLPNTYTSQVYEFYIRNNGGQTMSAGWTLQITPKATGPHG